MLCATYGRHRGPHLDYQHQVYLQEGTTAPTLSPPAEKSKPPSTHPHHLLQGYHWERADQLHHCLVRKLLCSRPQDPPADSEHRCKNHWCPSPLHPGHFPYTMLRKAKSIVEDPTHPSHSLFQLLPSGRRYRSIRARSARLLNSFFPRLWEPWTHITPPLSETPNNTPPPPPTSQKKLLKLLSLWNSGERACTSHL